MSQIDPIYIELGSRVGRGKSELVPIILQKIANMEQAKIMRELPNTTEVIADTLSMDNETVENNLQYLFERGVVTPGRSGWNQVTSTVLLKDFVAIAADKYYDKELINITRDMSLEDPMDMAERIRRGEEELPLRQTFRVVPKWRTIKDIQSDG